MINKYSILNDAKYFSSDGLQNYLVLISVRRVGVNNSTDKIELWGSTGRSEEEIKNAHISDVIFSPKLIDNFRFRKVKFEGICLKRDSESFLHKKIVNLYIYYELNTWSKDLNTDSALGNCLFRAVKLTKNADPDKYRYSSYHIECNSRSKDRWKHGKNVIIVGVDNSSSVHIDGRN